MRTRMVAGNWKMNKTLQEGVELAQTLKNDVKNPNCAVV
ncbi:MAG: triose-phosphate isomerase, partial [Paludibacteraceae bacterium]|nr:triose-phosphate isomerase [Paludibacteraceae bacterium]